MNQREHIAAYTEPGCSYPAYISVNSEPEGKVSVTVRETGLTDTSIIYMTHEQVENLATEIIAWLFEEN